MGMSGFNEEWLEQRQQGNSAGRGLPDEVTCALGIDPGAETGLVLWDLGEERILNAWTSDFHGAVEHMRSHPPGNMLVVLETPKDNPFMYLRHVKDLKSAIGGPSHKVWEEAKKAMRIAMQVGENHKEGELLREIAEERHHLRTVTPSGEKWDAEKCNLILGYPLPNNNPFHNNPHVRDALRFLHQEGVIPDQGCAHLSLK